MPNIEEMRKSQSAGSTGTGTDRSFADKMAERNQGTGPSEEKDEQFAEASVAKEYSLAGIL